MKRAHIKTRLKPILSLVETEAHEKSMAFTNDFLKMVDQRIKLATRLKSEHEQLTVLLSVALADVRNMIPGIVRQADQIEADTRAFIQKARDAGEEDMVIEMTKTLELWAAAPWKRRIA